MYLCFQKKLQNNNFYELYFNGDVEKNAEWIHTLLFGDENEEIVDLLWDKIMKDERLRLAIFARLKKVSVILKTIWTKC